MKIRSGPITLYIWNTTQWYKVLYSGAYIVPMGWRGDRGSTSVMYLDKRVPQSVLWVVDLDRCPVMKTKIMILTKTGETTATTLSKSIDVASLWIFAARGVFKMKKKKKLRVFGVVEFGKSHAQRWMWLYFNHNLKFHNRWSTHSTEYTSQTLFV